MVEIDKKNINGLIITLKGIIPANYESMDRLVNCVSYLQSLLEPPKDEEVKTDG